MIKEDDAQFNCITFVSFLAILIKRETFFDLTSTHIFQVRYHTNFFQPCYS